MSVPAHYEDTDLALFAMQLLDGEAHRAVANHVSGCAFCRQELARLQGDLAACAYGIEMHSPAAVVRERVLHQVAREKKAPPVEEVERSPRIEAVPPMEDLDEPKLEFRTRNGNNPKAVGRGRDADAGAQTRGRSDGHLLKDIFLWLGWAIAAALAVAGTKMYHEQEGYKARLAVQASEVEQLRDDVAGSRRLLETITDTSSQQVLLSGAAEETGKPSPEGHVIYMANKGALILLAHNLAPLEPERVYELWLIPADGRDPIPAGTFHPDDKGNGSVVLPPLPKAVRAKAFGVTVEEGNGTQSPTMPIVLAGS